MDLFFITGLPKTGSSWLMNMLNDVPGIKCMGEGRFFSSGIKNIPSLFDSLNNGLGKWINYIAERKYNWFDNCLVINTIEERNYVVDNDKERIKEKLTKTTIRHIVNEIMISRVGNDTQIIGDKTPTTIIDELDRISNIFHDAKIIFLHRGIYDFLASFIMHFYRATKNNRPDANFECFSVKDFLQIHSFLNNESDTIITSERLMYLIKMWREFDDRFSKTKSSNCILPVRYEELRIDTELTLSKIVKFLIGDQYTNEIDNVIKRWDFDSKNMSSRVRSEHVNSRDLGYGESLFNKNLRNVIDYNIKT